MPEWKMDRWKFFDITHKNHVVCNPTSLEKLDELCRLLNLEPGASVLDIACGKAELLVRLVEMHGIRGVGVDLSPYFVAEAEKKRQARVPDAGITFLHMDGADYRPDEPEGFDVAMCLGASWVFKGHRGTLKALMDMAKRGGLVVAGEPHWIQKPPPEYLASSGMAEETFSTIYGNLAIGQELGLTPLYMLVSSKRDLDHYEALQWHAVDQHARANPSDPDLPEVLRLAARYREEYLRWGRDTLGWGIHLFRKP